MRISSNAKKTRNQTASHKRRQHFNEHALEDLITASRTFPPTSRVDLRNSAIVFEMMRNGVITLEFDCNDHLSHLEALANRYADQCPDFADLCLIRMSELFPRHPVVTIDRGDFRVYRRNKREAIPLICPPEK